MFCFWWVSGQKKSDPRTQPIFYFSIKARAPSSGHTLPPIQSKNVEGKEIVFLHWFYMSLHQVGASALTLLGKKNRSPGTSLVIQWLRLRTSTAGGTGLIPGRGTKISHASWYDQKKQTKKKTEEEEPGHIKDCTWFWNETDPSSIPDSPFTNCVTLVSY